MNGQPAGWCASRLTSLKQTVIASLTFFCPAGAHAAWDKFEIIHWQQRDATQLAELRRIGITAVTVLASRSGDSAYVEQQIAAPRAAGLRWYIENIATDFYSPYHQFTAGKIENWRFLVAQDQYRVNPADQTAFHRVPSLLDPAWRARIRDRLTDVVSRNKRGQPLFYSLGDETGIADLSSFWDFDLSPQSVAGFRAWLKQQYRSLAALNAEWGTSWTSWDLIEPETTAPAMRRSDDNFAAWNDFKAWMDTQFAEAVRFGTDAIHKADPQARSAIEGAQIPGWGGYDYTKLAHAADVMEIYEFGENLPILRSINPRVIPLVTSFGGTPDDIHRVWRGVLRGARGVVLWDEDNGIVQKDGSPGPRAGTYAPLFAALHGDIGRGLIQSRLIHDPVAILYSPVSFRISWMLDHRGSGDAWASRSAETEMGDSAWRAALSGYAKELAGLGLRPRYITPDALAKGPPREKILILPHTFALSERETASIRRFVAAGGQVIADMPPGAFNGHGRRQTPPRLPVTIARPEDLAGIVKLRPAIKVEAPDGDVETYLYNSGNRRFLALHPRALRQTQETVTMHLNGREARDLATGQRYTGAQSVTVTLDLVTPVFLELGR